MSEAKETIKAIQVSHSALFVVAATAIVLLFASPETDYMEALREAYELQSIQMAEYEVFARFEAAPNDMLPSRLASPSNSQEIVQFLEVQLGWSVHRASSPRATVMPILEYPGPPASGSLKDWKTWISSVESVKFWEPDWDTASLSSTRNAPEQPPIIRFFSLKPSSSNRTPGEYTFRAFLDWNVTDADLSQYAHLSTDVVDDWWSEIDQLSSRELWGSKMIGGELRREDRLVIEGNVDSALRDGRFNSGIQHWLKSSGAWAQLAKTTGLGELLLPNMHAHWSVISDLTLDESVAFMEAKMTEVKDVNIFGVPVPGRLCAIAIAVAFLLVLLRMLLYARRLVSLKDIVASEGINEAPWIGLYHDPLAKWTTIISIVVVPASLSLGVIAKYYSYLDSVANFISITFVILSGICSVNLLRQVHEVRQVLSSNVVTEQGHAADARTSRG